MVLIGHNGQERAAEKERIRLEKQKEKERKQAEKAAEKIRKDAEKKAAAEQRKAQQAAARAEAQERVCPQFICDGYLEAWTPFCARVRQACRICAHRAHAVMQRQIS